MIKIHTRLLSLCCLLSFSVLADQPLKSYASAETDALIKRIQTHYPALKTPWIKQQISDATVLDSVIRLINKPAERTLNWEQYRAIFMMPKRINAGKAFYQKHKTLFNAAEQQYGVSKWTILAIMGVETYYGQILGTYSVMDALITLSIHPESKRSPFFTAQLADYLLLIKRGIIDHSAVGSYAGAVGMGQFIPTSIRRWAVDADENGSIELSTSPKDAIYSIANYLAEHGWHTAKGIAQPASKNNDKALEYKMNDGSEWWQPLDNFAIIKTYNRSNLYALAVHSLSQAVQMR